MPKSIETVITVLYYPRDSTTDVWVTQRENGPQFEMLAMKFDAGVAIKNAINEAIRLVSAFGD
jgi:hypothetical protein